MSFRRYLLLAAVCTPALFPRCAPAAEPEGDVVSRTFASLDRDEDKSLSLDEYLQRPGNGAMHRRDFHLFDFNRSHSLSRAEFAAVPGLTAPHLRGAVPDPADELLEAAVAALDETYPQWVQNPDAQIHKTTFVVAFVESLADSAGERSLAPSQWPIADDDGDDNVTRGEAVNYLKIQLGIVSRAGDPLRRPEGRVLHIKKFPWLDVDKDGDVTREEYLARVPGERGEQQFQEGDSDHDGRLTWEEFSDPAWAPGYEDPIEFFRRADADFDGLVDASELTAAVPAWRQPALPLLLPAFDEDGDGKLSLREYELSPFGNFLCSWESIRSDANSDQSLSFNEFLFDRETCLLLQRLYFSRLDRDGDGRLAAAEYAFQVIPPRALYTVTADGSSFRKLWEDPAYADGGSPEYSPDGRWIAFDHYKSGKILKISSDGKELQVLTSGLMPSWSADGSQFAFSGSGVQIAAADGSNPKRFSAGWAAQWSPDGKSIAFTQNNGLSVYDVATETTREVLPQAAHPYSELYYGMTWSPDSCFVAIKAVKGGGIDLISIDVKGPKPAFKVLFSKPTGVRHNLTWAPDGRRLVFVMLSDEHKRELPYQLDLEAGGEPTLLPGIDPALSYTDVQFHPDGNSLILFAR